VPGLSGHARQLRFREGALDERKQHAFLVPDVTLEARAELVQRLGIDLGRLRQIGPPPAEVNVLDQHAHDGRVIGRAVARERGQEDLLLEPEVLAPVVLPELEESGAHLARVGRVGAPEPLRQEEAPMVVSGERCESVASLHRVDFT
jgi:hypothetical protein